MRQLIRLCLVLSPTQCEHCNLPNVRLGVPRFPTQQGMWFRQLWKVATVRLMTHISLYKGWVRMPASPQQTEFLDLCKVDNPLKRLRDCMWCRVGEVVFLSWLFWPDKFCSKILRSNLAAWKFSLFLSSVLMFAKLHLLSHTQDRPLLCLHLTIW